MCCFKVYHICYNLPIEFRPLKMRSPCCLETSGANDTLLLSHIPVQIKPQFLMRYTRTDESKSFICLFIYLS